MSAVADLSRKLTERTAAVAVVGLGYAGLPLAEAFARAGLEVLGLDVDAGRVASLERGESYLAHVPTSRVRELRASGRFRASTELRQLAQADATVLCVPTPLTPSRDPDLSAVEAATRSCAAVLRRGQLMVLESTTYPGTTRGVVLPILEEAAHARGLTFGDDYFVAFSPEREDPGNREFSVTSIPRVVGGLDTASGRLASQLFAAVAPKVVTVSSAEVAEACKILENTYRAVNIALVNELKVLYDRMGIDVWEVIEAARTKPFGFQAFYPGPGLGGHCIPIDPFYLAWVGRKVGVPVRFVELAGEINTFMPAFVAGKVADALNDRGRAVRGSRVLLLGLAYKRDVDDPRESPALELYELLSHKGAEVVCNDPHVPRVADHRRGLDLCSKPLTTELLAEQDCTVIVTDHSAYDWDWVVAHSSLVVDTRNATRNVRQLRDRIVRA